MTRQKLTSEQSHELAIQCNAMSGALGDYLMEHLGELTLKQRGQIQDAREELLAWSGKLIKGALQLQLEDLAGTLQRIEGATREVRKAIRRIQAVREAIDVATAVLQLGRAIATGNPSAIGDALTAASAAARAAGG